MQLGDIVDHFADIDELDLDGVEPMTQPFPLANVLREDVVAPASTATRCSPRPRRSRTVASGSRRSSGWTNDRACQQKRAMERQRQSVNRGLRGRGTP